MSAVLALDPSPQAPAGLAPQPRPEWQPHRRPRLRLVPTGAELPGRTRPRSLGLGRRGRLVRFAGAVAVAVSLGWTVVDAVVSSAAVPPRSVTVQSGQTLSEIAARELPDLPSRDAVARLQLANGLSSSDVHAGQVLQIPVGG